MMRNLIFVVVVLFLSVVVANTEVRELERAEHCIDGYDTNGRDDLRLTEDIVFSGDPMVFNGWGAPYNTMTIQFAGEGPIIWSPETEVSVPESQYHMALADWIETFTSFQKNYGFRIFALQSPDDGLWVVSQFQFPDGELGCFAHPVWLD